MDRVLKETEVKERFAERDIRAKVGSDLATIEEAQRLRATPIPASHRSTIAVPPRSFGRQNRRSHELRIAHPAVNCTVAKF
jgi:hypothetical protein